MTDNTQPQDTELFELCSDVYKRFPDWDYEELHWMIDTGSPVPFVSPSHGRKQIVEESDYPIYTSDYLLEKLPPKITHKGTDYFYYLEMFEDGTFGTGYGFTDEGGHVDLPKIGVLTAGKAQLANLRLVIALDDAGVKLS